VLVTAENGTTKTYTVTVTRAAAPALSSNTNLASLTASAGSLSPSFNQNTTSYSLSVANGVASTTVTPTLADTKASVRVNGSAASSGSASSSLALNVGANAITVLVTAENGTTKTYTVTVTRAAPVTPEPTLNQGLVGYWALDGDLNDLSGGDHHGTGRGSAPIAYAAAQFGQGVDLNGINQFVEITGGPESDFAGESMSLSAWFRVDAFTVNWQALIAKGESGNWRTHRRDNTNGMAFSAGPGNNDTPDSRVNVRDGKLHHLVAVARDGEGSELWIDGELVASTDNTEIENNNRRVFFGDNPDAVGRFWNGFIDDVGIWGRALDPAEIALIWNDGNGKSLADLSGAGGDSFQITDIQHIAGVPRKIRTTWQSEPGATYVLEQSTDMIFWQAFGGDLPSDGTTTSVEVELPSPPREELYLRAKRK
jgi:hypothetical protein